MGNLLITGSVANANGCATIISVSGPDGYHHQEVRDDNFNISLSVNPGLYVIFIHGDTDGTLTIDITGDLTSVDPKVPMNLQQKFAQVFHATISS